MFTLLRRARLVVVLAALLGSFLLAAPARADSPPPPEFAYIPNLFSSTVSVLNLATGVVDSTITVSFPYGTAVSNDRSRVYVTSLLGGGTGGGDSVAVIDTATKTVLRTIELGAYGSVQPNGVAVDSVRNKLYVANSNLDTLGIIDLTTDTVTQVAVGDNPLGVAVGPGGRKVYVTNYNSGTVSVYDTVSGTVTATITVGTQPAGIDVTGEARKAYVANSGSGTVSVIDLRTDTVRRTVTLATGATPEAVSVRGERVAVSNVGVGGITLLNTGNDRVARTIAFDGSWGIDVARNGRLVVSLPGTGEAAILRYLNPASTTVVATGNLPLGLGHFIAR